MVKITIRILIKLFENKNGTNLQLSRNVMLERTVPFFIFYTPSFDI